MDRAIISLDGTWRLAKHEAAMAAGEAPSTEGLEWIEGTVPGAVPTDLVAAGRLANPLASASAAREADWVARSDWLYSTEFDADPEIVAAPTRYLLLDGVDTYSDVWLNGVHVGTTANMFRSYRLDVGHVPLRPAANSLLILVKSHYPQIAARVEAASRLRTVSHPNSFRARSLIRRYQRSFDGSLLGIGAEVISIGVYGSVSLLACADARVDDLSFAVESASEDLARATVGVRLGFAEGAERPVRVEARLLEDRASEPAWSASVEAAGQDVALALEISNPRLWWPRGAGAASLYTLEVAVYRGDERLDLVSRRVGIKQARIVRREATGRETFYFEINGRKVYVRGGNMIPIDALRARVTPSEYDSLLRLVEHANMNLIRLWGGGVPEHEHFLDECDSRGIMVWQDFFYHSGTYPDYDPEFMAEAEREAEDVIRRMRRHACLTLFCGGNEQLQGWDEWNWRATLDRHYGEKLFTELLPAVCAREAPEVPYITNSPHGGKQCQSPTSGDTHTWFDFYNATKDPLFVTETCWGAESYGRPETLREVMGLDVDALAGPDWPRRWRELTDLPLRTKFPHSQYQDPTSLRRYLRSLEIEQLEAETNALDMLRLRSSSCNGIVYWPINKGGPAFIFGCVDYAGRPLMAYYGLRRVFADVRLGLYRDVDDVRVVGSNLTGEAVTGELRIEHLTSGGERLGVGDVPVVLPPGNSVRLHDLPGFMDGVRDRTSELVRATLATRAAGDREETLFFCPLVDFDETPGRLAVRAARVGERQWRLDLSADRVARLVEVESSARLLLEDDYFTLAPGAPRSVLVEALESADEPIAVTVSAWDGRVSADVTLVGAGPVRGSAG